MLGHGKSMEASQLHINNFQLNNLANDILSIFLYIKHTNPSFPLSTPDSIITLEGSNHDSDASTHVGSSGSNHRFSTVALIGHSLGAAIAALLYPKMKRCVGAMILIGPRYDIPVGLLSIASLVPELVLNIFRLYE